MKLCSPANICLGLADSIFVRATTDAGNRGRDMGQEIGERYPCRASPWLARAFRLPLASLIGG